MELPRSQRFGDVWALVWDQQQVAMGFERVHESRGDIWAQVVVESRSAAKQGRVLGPVRLNLMAMQSQASFAKSCAERLRDVPWGEMVVDACALVVKQFSDPAAPVHLREVNRSGGRQEYLLPGLVPLGETTFCYGDSESMKSLLCQLIAVCVETGAQLPWGVRALDRMSVLYLDWETNDVVLAERVHRLAAGLGVEAPDIIYRGVQRGRDVAPLRALIDEVPHIRAEVQKLGIGLVIVDSIGFAVDGKLVDDDIARGAMSALRQLAPATRLVVAHISKESQRQGGGRVDPFGSTFFRAGIRSGFEVRRSEEDGLDGSVDIGIYHWKSNDGAHVKPFSLRVCFVPDGGPITVARQDMASVPDLAIRTSLSSRLWDLMADGEKVIWEMAEATGADPKVIDSTLRRMPNVMRIDHGGRGVPASWGRRA